MHHGDLLLELGLVLLGLGILARLGHRLGLSPIPLYLLAGLAFGRGGILPLDTTGDFFQVGADIGVILLLLLLGLEYSAEELVSNLKVGVPAGLMDFALNFTPGLVAGLLLGWGPIAAMVLGGVTYVSSSGIIAKTLSDLDRLGNRETPVILSILVMEDLAMAVYLPVVTALVVGGGLVAAALPISIAIFCVGMILLIAVRYGRLISRAMASPNDEILMLLALGLTLTVAGLAEGVQVSAGVGAFIVGIALSDRVAVGAHQVLKPLRDLFAAVFFLFFGLQTNASEVPPVLLAAFGLAVITAVTKLATGYWAAKRVGIGRKGRIRAGVTLIARGEFSVVVAGLASGAGLDPRLAPLAAAYVLILAIAGPVATRFVGGAPPKKVRPPKEPITLH